MKKILCIVLVFMFSFSIISSSKLNTCYAENSTVASASQEDDKLSEGLGNGSKVTINRLKTKEEKIAQYTEDLGGNKTNGTVLYWLNVVKDYSVPVFFVLLVIASLNFFIIGNKKLDKREQGFSMLVTLIIGLIVFQVLPFLFAIIVAGR